jgi:outer membrane protein OmpA-like peptidoglycan-associated protein
VNRLLAVSAAALLAAGCASDQAAMKAAAAPLPWCNPCTYPSACTSPCAPPAVAAAPAPAKKPYVPPPSPALSAAFDPTPGEYQDGQQVKLTSPTPGAVIHYTLDGSAPTAASPVYTGPIAVDKTTTIRAVVTAPDVPESSVSQGEYVIAPPPPPAPQAAAPAPAPAPAPPPAAPAPAPRVKVTEKKLELLEKVYFDTSKTTIKSASLPLLDEVAQVLNSNPQVKKVVIEGHTDNQGAADLNTKLSQGRADAVRAYLTKKGVAAERLDSKGFGPTRPIGDNKTAKGREANRRVEFVIP